MSQGGVPSNVSVGVTAQLVLRANRFRKRVTFGNTSVNRIHLSHASQLTTSTGIPINAGAGLIDESSLVDPVYPGDWWGIATVAASNLSIEEET